MLLDILIFIQFLLVIAFAGILFYIAYIMFSFKNFVPFVPTPNKILRRMVAMAEIKPGERVCDLGSGTGRIIITAGKMNKQNLILGVEKSLYLRFITKLKLFFLPQLRNRVQVSNQDLFNLDLHNFDVIFCFLNPAALRLLTAKFQTLKKDSRIVCYMFPLEEYPNYTETMKHLTDKDSLYLYRKIN
jgi:precorrin-6B methylase 2